MSGHEIKVTLPGHLRGLIGVGAGAINLTVTEATLGGVLNELEERYPVLRGTIRDHDQQRRRALVRFFACEQDLSHEPMEFPLPAAVLSGKEPFLIVGAMAGG